MSVCPFVHRLGEAVVVILLICDRPKRGSRQKRKFRPEGWRYIKIRHAAVCAAVVGIAYRAELLITARRAAVLIGARLTSAGAFS